MSLPINHLPYFRGVFEFAYLLFNVFSHFDAFLCLAPISLSPFRSCGVNSLFPTNSGDKMEKVCVCTIIQVNQWETEEVPAGGQTTALSGVLQDFAYLHTYYHLLYFMVRYETPKVQGVTGPTVRR